MSKNTLYAILSSVLILLDLPVIFAQRDSLNIYYFDHSPFAYTEAGVLKGIEIDIANEYVLWLNTKKKISTTFHYKGFSDFSEFYSAVKRAGKNTLGLGSVTLNTDRLREVDFAAPYLKNVAFCVTNGHAPDVKTKNSDEIIRALGSMTALSLLNSNLQRYTTELKRTYLQDITISYYPNEVKILDAISRNVLNFGYVYAIDFWYYLKNNPDRFLKLQKILSQAKEEMCFIFPKGSPHRDLFNEFFSSKESFLYSPAYRAIVEKHLSTYLAQSMVVN